MGITRPLKTEVIVPSASIASALSFASVRPFSSALSFASARPFSSAVSLLLPTIRVSRKGTAIAIAMAARKGT